MGHLVSVIIASYNAAKYIGPAISSILRQNYPFFEIIIVDDASKDNTLEILKSFHDNRIRVLQHRENAGPGKARNTAIEAATGKYIAVTDADDLNMPQRLQVQVDFLESHPEVDVVGSNMYVFNDQGNILGGLSINFTEHEDLIRHINRGIPLAHATIMARAAWFKKYKYRAEYKRAQDRELFFRAFRHSRFAHIPQFLYACRDPGKLNPKKLVLNNYYNILMRFRHWQEYGIPVSQVLSFPPLVIARMGYYIIAGLCGRSLLWGHMTKVIDSEELVNDKEWISSCLMVKGVL